MLRRMSLSVCIITLNEEANVGRTLKSVKEIANEIVIVDSGSTDATVSIARSFGAKVFVEPWKGFARQKNSALRRRRAIGFSRLMPTKKRVRNLQPVSGRC